jgi:hypothetical protein
MHTNSAHASTCGAIAPSGDQDARSSICAPSPSAAREPKPLESVFVAVPEAEWNPARRDASASVSHVQATSARSGSTPISGSSGAWAKHTMRQGPFHGAGSSGSCSSTSRPVPYGESTSSGEERTSPAIASACGASPCGAGISRTVRSSRNEIERTASAACSNELGAAGGRWSATRTD